MRNVISGAVLALAAMLVAVPALHAQTVIRVEHDENSSSNTHKVLTEMASEIASESGGKLKLEVHAGASLSGGKITTMIQNVQAGNVDAGWIATSIYTGVDPRVGVLSLPFMFKDMDGLERVRRKGTLNDFYAEQENRNLHVVDAWSRPLRQFINNKRAITKPSDAAGLRFRVPEIKLWVDAFKAINAQPLPLPFSEIPTAMQLGTIDGAERPTDYLVAERWWDLAKYVSLVNYSGDAVMVSFNKTFWGKLDPAMQQLLEKKIRQFGNKKYDIDKVAAEQAIAEAKSHGMLINTVDAEGLKQFREAMKSVWTDHAKQIGQPLIDRVSAVSTQE
jgi:TRAP-type C4-dicarboxylate transport system substrate-binding protein